MRLGVVEAARGRYWSGHLRPTLGSEALPPRANISCSSNSQSSSESTPGCGEHCTSLIELASRESQDRPEPVVECGHDETRPCGTDGSLPLCLVPTMLMKPCLLLGARHFRVVDMRAIEATCASPERDRLVESPPRSAESILRAATRPPSSLFSAAMLAFLVRGVRIMIEERS